MHINEQHKVRSPTEDGVTIEGCEATDNTPIIIYTDGACSNNQVGNWAGSSYVMIDPNNEGKVETWNYSAIGSNNTAELEAIQGALYAARQKDINDIIIKSDSLYAINVIAGTYKAKKNTELILKIRNTLKAMTDNGWNIRLEHVEAHTGNKSEDAKYNALADKLAKEAARRDFECEVMDTINVENLNSGTYYITGADFTHNTLTLQHE